MRRTLAPISFALLIAFYWSAAETGGQSKGHPQAGPPPLRVMSYNIHHGSGNIASTNVLVRPGIARRQGRSASHS